jgi:membrane protease YdiL (CAAX protease family)
MSNQTANPWRSWKGGLAALSLLLCALLWLNGLVGSLERPSVGNALLLRQQELAVLAEPALPKPLRGALLGAGDPRRQLAAELARQAAASEVPLPDQQLYTWGLLEASAGQADKARQILSGLADRQGSQRHATALQRQLQCEQHRSTAAAPTCIDPGVAQRSLLRVLAITVFPAGLMLLGVALLIRQLWLWSRRRLPAPAPLLGPPLSLVDAVLLVAGGFVVLGELLTPLLVAPLLQQLVAPLARSQPALQQATTVLGLYLALMLGPLLILRWMLQALGPQPIGGWLQWRWRPWLGCARRALATLLMVLPLVALVGWLLDHLWADPGGSNPLLEMVLTSSSPLALLLLSSTALVLAPLFEETLFRGVLLPVVARSWGSAWGVLISAASFALAHLSLGELLPLFVLGLGLGWLRLQSGRLGASVLMHALWNGLTFANLLLLAG